MKVQGRLRISRPQGGGDERIHVELRDMLAGVAFAVAEIPLEEFARCLTGTSEECRIELRGLDLVGTVREHKHEIVRVADLWSRYGEKAEDRLRRVREAVAAHERDDWRGRDEDALNHHNRAPNHDLLEMDGTRLYAWLVTYTRNVAADCERLDT